jgi:hypothetical protein
MAGKAATSTNTYTYQPVKGRASTYTVYAKGVQVGTVARMALVGGTAPTKGNTWQATATHNGGATAYGANRAAAMHAAIAAPAPVTPAPKPQPATTACACGQPAMANGAQCAVCAAATRTAAVNAAWATTPQGTAAAAGTGPCAVCAVVGPYAVCAACGVYGACGACGAHGNCALPAQGPAGALATQVHAALARHQAATYTPASGPTRWGGHVPGTAASTAHGAATQALNTAYQAARTAWATGTHGQLTAAHKAWHNAQVALAQYAQVANTPAPAPTGPVQPAQPAWLYPAPPVAPQPRSGAHTAVVVAVVVLVAVLTATAVAAHLATRPYTLAAQGAATGARHLRAWLATQRTL